MSKLVVPLAVFYSNDGGEWWIRDYAGQSGRFCVIGPYTVDILASYRTLKEAKTHVEKFGGPGFWAGGRPGGQ